MQRCVVLNKNEGDTPLQALEQYRLANSISSDVPLTYAGRLDPMASGKLLILIGEECKQREKYDALDKEYDFEILFGFTTDTGDILGLADACASPVQVEEAELRQVARDMRGERTMAYPAFSSKPVNGKPLYEYALEDRLHEIQIPSMQAHIRRLQVLGMRQASQEELLGDIERRLSLLHIDSQSTNPHKDFRRDAILARWCEHLGTGNGKFSIARMRATVSTGTYIRSLAPLIAEHAAACGIAYSIHRTRIGRYVALTPSMGFWSRSY